MTPEAEEQPRLESVLPGDALAAAPGEPADGSGPRRRRRRGRGDRAERGERGAREGKPAESMPEATSAAPAENVVVPLAAVEPPPSSPEPAVATAPAPVAPLAEPVAFHAVSEHQEMEEVHRPLRRRRRASDEAVEAPAPLQLVETTAEIAPPAMEDELPRRTRPRRRRSAAMDNGPLMLVETQMPIESPQPPRADNPPAP